jgi:hypothetical protein
MSKSETQNSEPPKKGNYNAPVVLRVSLRPEEAVLGHCKTSSAAGPASAGCRSASGGCMSLGS